MKFIKYDDLQIKHYCLIANLEMKSCTFQKQLLFTTINIEQISFY